MDGYEVTLDGDLVPGAGRLLTLTVRKDGRPVTDLQPYLAAYGHLVILSIPGVAQAAPPPSSSDVTKHPALVGQLP